MDNKQIVEALKAHHWSYETDRKRFSYLKSSKEVVIGTENHLVPVTVFKVKYVNGAMTSEKKEVKMLLNRTSLTDMADKGDIEIVKIIYISRDGQETEFPSLVYETALHMLDKMYMTEGRVAVSRTKGPELLYVFPVQKILDSSDPKLMKWARILKSARDLDGNITSEAQKRIQRELASTCVNVVNDGPVNILFLDFEKSSYKFGIPCSPFGEMGDGYAVTRHLFYAAKENMSLHSLICRILSDDTSCGIEEAKFALQHDPTSVGSIAEAFGFDPANIDIICALQNVKYGTVKHGDVVTLNWSDVKMVGYNNYRKSQKATLPVTTSVLYGDFGKSFVKLLTERGDTPKIAEAIVSSSSMEVSAIDKLTSTSLDLGKEHVSNLQLACAFPVKNSSGKHVIARTPWNVQTLVELQAASALRGLRKQRVDGAVMVVGFCPYCESINNARHAEKKFDGVFPIRIVRDGDYIVQALTCHEPIARILADMDGDTLHLIYLGNGIWLGIKYPALGQTAILFYEDGTDYMIPAEWQWLADTWLKFPTPKVPEKGKKIVLETAKDIIKAVTETNQAMRIAMNGLSMPTYTAMANALWHMFKSEHIAMVYVLAYAMKIELDGLKGMKTNLKSCVEFFQAMFGDVFHFYKLAQEKHNASIIPQHFMQKEVTSAFQKLLDLLSKPKKDSKGAWIANIAVVAKEIGLYIDKIALAFAYSGLAGYTQPSVVSDDMEKMNDTVSCIIRNAASYGIEGDVAVVRNLAQIFNSYATEMLNSKTAGVVDLIEKVQGHMVRVAKASDRLAEKIACGKEIHAFCVRKTEYSDVTAMTDKVGGLYTRAHVNYYVGINGIKNKDIRKFAYSCVYAYLRSIVSGYKHAPLFALCIGELSLTPVGKGGLFGQAMRALAVSSPVEVAKLSKIWKSIDLEFSDIEVTDVTPLALPAPANTTTEPPIVEAVVEEVVTPPPVDDAASRFINSVNDEYADMLDAEAGRNSSYDEEFE